MQAKFTRQAKAALQIAESAARSWKHSYIGTEHILVGLLKEQEGTAGKILEEFGVDPEKLETLITQLIAPSGVLGGRKICRLQSESPKDQRAGCKRSRETERGTGRNRTSASGNAEGNRLCRHQTFIYHGSEYPETI